MKLLAKFTSGRLTLIHVADGFTARNQQLFGLAESEEMQKDRAYLQRRQDELASDGLSVEIILECGEPSDQILKIANERQCDLIAMSTHGHRFIKDILLGSVAEEVRHKANVPVLLLRAQA